MKKIFLIVMATTALFSCEEEGKKPKKEPRKEIALTYTDTKKVDTVDTYFGTEVKDPYRWLEDDRSEETMDWVKRENGTTQDYLKNIPFREELKERLSTLWNYEGKILLRQRCF